jgi:nucleoside-diphosphate-sugar epimerase
MKVLVTGASGFIGHSVLAFLNSHHIEGVAVGRTCPVGYSGQFIAADLLMPAACADVVRKAKASHLVHLAWYAEHGQYWTSPLNLRWVEASIHLIESFCQSGGAQVVMTGTCAEYDWSTGYFLEDASTLSPATLYGASKDATRRLASHICADYDTRFAWGRIFVPYGPEEDVRRLIPSLVRVFRGQGSPFGVNAGAYRDLLHVDDVASAIMQLALTSSTGSYNIASGQPTLISDLVSWIANASGKDPGIVLGRVTERPNEPRMLIGDNQKLKNIGWRMEKNLIDYILERMAG